MLGFTVIIVLVAGINPVTAGDGSGEGLPVLVGLYEVCQQWQNLYNTIQFYSF